MQLTSQLNAEKLKDVDRIASSKWHFPNYQHWQALAMLWGAILALILITVVAHAQSGSVNGQVFCSDTQKPARFARVFLADAYVLNKMAGGSRFEKQRDVDQNAAITLPDGSFVLKNLPAGVYDLQISYPGYINPQLWLSTGHVSPATLQSWINLYTQVTVLPGRTVSTIATIYRGAEMTGTVTFDDGSPAEGYTVAPIYALPVLGGSDNSPSGTVPAENLIGLANAFQATTDAHGKFLIAGLVSGTYSLMATPREGHSLFPVYLGNTVDLSTAKLVTIQAGEEHTDLNLEIDLNSFHQVRGIVTTADNRPLPKVGIALERAVDGAPQRPYIHAADDGSFVFSYVPDGDYRLLMDGDPSKKIVKVQGADITDIVLTRKQTQ